jgi:hypothetical protein
MKERGEAGARQKRFRFEWNALALMRPWAMNGTIQRILPILAGRVCHADRSCVDNRGQLTQ